MAKRRKLKKGTVLILGVILFFLVYFISFNFGRYLDQGNLDPVKVENKKEEDKRPLMTQLNTEEKIYLSDQSVENVRIEESYWSKLKVLFKEFAEIRNPDGYTPIYNGYSANGIRFSTDLNYFRVYTVNKEQYYKVPVALKEEFETNLAESIYLSFDFVRQYKSWETVKVSYNNDIKKIHKWKFDDLSYKMGSKRSVGKVQPEKSKERSEYNFTINIQGEQYDSKIETMGKNYVKISAGEGDEMVEAYYEVHTGLYEYFVYDVFKLEKKEYK